MAPCGLWLSKSRGDVEVAVGAERHPIPRSDNSGTKRCWDDGGTCEHAEVGPGSFVVPKDAVAVSTHHQQVCMDLRTHQGGQGTYHQTGDVGSQLTRLHKLPPSRRSGLCRTSIGPVALRTQTPRQGSPGRATLQCATS